MSKVTKITEYQGANIIPLLGENLLADIEPKVVSKETGGHPEYKNWRNRVDASAYKLLTVPFTGEMDEHIDIFSENFTLSYDLGRVVDIDELFTAGYWHGSNGIYMLGEYELHVAENEADLFTEKSLVVAVDNADISGHGIPRTSEAFFKCEGVKGQFVGFKMKKANATDDITRLANFGAYNDAITEQKAFVKKHTDVNILKSEDITLPEGSKGCPCNLVDGTVFDKNFAVTLGGSDIVITPEKATDYIMVAGLFDGFTVYTSDNKDDVFSCPAAGQVIPYDTGAHEESFAIFKLDSAKKYIGIKVADGAVIEQLGAYSYLFDATVDLDNVKTKDFIGIGANDIPMALMPESRHEGFRNVYWPIYRHRMAKARPTAVRVWFQVDWVVTNEEDYLAGICNFQSDKMRQFLPYMEAYENAGIEVELNFGWKASTEIYEWFSIPSTGAHKMGGQGKSASAPKNFEGFAKCCAETVKYLAEEKGFTCLKHLTFYNESNYGDGVDFMASDFAGYNGKSKEMWEKMLRLVDKELKARGADKYVDYWLAEQSGSDETELQWIDYMMTNCRDLNSLNTFHRYKLTYKERLAYFEQVVKHAGEVGAIASEFAIYTPPIWNRSNIEYIMSMLHSGLRGGLYWCLQTVKMTDPTWLYLGIGERDYGFWWQPPYEEDGQCMETLSYFDFCLFTRYAPCHSKVLETTNENEDIRIETLVTPDGHYTVFVESKEAKFDKKVEIKFSKNIGKTFQKHVYKASEIKRDGNLTVPPVQKEIEVGDTLRDTLDADYQFVCYTTAPALKQLELNTTKVTVPMNGNFQLEATPIDCEGEVVWEIAASDGVPCILSADGVVSAAELTRPGDVHTVKAYLKDDPSVCGFAIVKFQ